MDAASPTLAGSTMVLLVLARLANALTYNSAIFRLAACSPSYMRMKNRGRQITMEPP